MAAAVTVSTIILDLSNDIKRWECSFTASTTNAGGFTAATLTVNQKQELLGWYLFQVISIPGATNPTTSWDYTLKDDSSVDLLGGVGADRSASAAELLIPKLDGTNYGDVPVDGGLTLAPVTNSVSGAIIVIHSYFRRVPGR